MARARDLRVIISGDEKGLVRAFTRSSGAAESFAKKSTSVHQRVGASFGQMAKHALQAGVGIAGAYASIEGAKKAIDTTEELAHATLGLHKNLGLSVKSASEWAAVARARGIDSKQLSQAFGTLAKNVEAGTKPTSAQADAFKRLGLSQAELKRGNFAEVLGDVADGMGKLHGGTEKTALGMKLFGRGWQTVLPVLREGSKGMRDQLALADKYGVTFKGKTVKSLEDLIKAQRESKFATMGLQVAFGTMLAPALTKAIGAVNKFVLGIREGTGAGGRFADKLKEIADKVRPIVKFFTDHPRLIAVAVGAWATYRIAAATALAASKLKLIGMFLGLAPKAAAGGAVAGRAFGGAASVSAGTTFNRRAPGMFAAGRFAGAGKVIGGLLGTAIMVEVASKFDGPAWAKILRGLVPFQPSPGGGNIKLGKPVKLPDGTTLFPAKGTVPPEAVPTQGATPLPARPPRRVPHRQSVHRSGNAPRAHTSAVVAHAASVMSSRTTRVTARAANAGDSGIVALGRQLQREGYTVGEHPAFGGVAPVHVQGSYHYRGEAIDVNGGPGGEPGSLDALYARLQGRPGIAELLWRVAGHFDHLHVAVVGATNPLSGATVNTGGTVAPSATSATSRGPLIARRGATVKSVAPHRMGHTATGGRGFEQTGEGAEPTQAQQDIKRQYQIAVRLQAINSELRKARGGRRAQLLDERARLTTELAGIGRAGGTADIPGADAYLASLDRQAAEAELTPDTADDLDVARRTLKARQDILDYEKSHGFSDTDIAQATRDVKAAQDAVDQGSQSQQALADALAANTAELKRQNDFAANVASVSSIQAVRALADIISGQITGTGYDPRAMTAGAGSLARY